MDRLKALLARVHGAAPRGWRDFGLQLAIWFGFLFAYQLARGIADRDPGEAFENGRLLIDLQNRLHALVEIDIQRVVLSAGDWLVQAVNWTYWNSQFTVVGLALLWVYFRRNDAFLRLRNVLLLANMLALVGFVLMPTAPPRLFPEWGFVDTLASSSTLNHGTGLIQLASNQFAAMPSIHAADALILGFVMAASCAPGPPSFSGRSGRCGSGSRSWRPRTTSGSTSPPGSPSPLSASLVLWLETAAPRRGPDRAAP